MIHRTNKTKRFSIVANKPFEDKNLSWAAKGILIYLLSKPDGWECRQYDLVNQGPGGKHLVSTAINQLIDLGYLKRRKYQDEKGHWQWMTEIFEDTENFSGPSEQEPQPETQFSDFGKTDFGKTDFGKSAHIVRTESSSTESVKTERDTPSKNKKTSTLDPLDHILSAKANGVKAEPDPYVLDQVFGYKDDFLASAQKYLEREFGFSLVEKELITEIAGLPNADLKLWEKSIKLADSKWPKKTGKEKPNVQRCIDLYNCGGDWSKFAAQEWPSEETHHEFIPGGIPEEDLPKLRRNGLAQRQAREKTFPAGMTEEQAAMYRVEVSKP